MNTVLLTAEPELGKCANGNLISHQHRLISQGFGSYLLHLLCELLKDERF